MILYLADITAELMFGVNFVQSLNCAWQLILFIKIKIKDYVLMLNE